MDVLEYFVPIFGGISLVLICCPLCVIFCCGSRNRCEICKEWCCCLCRCCERPCDCSCVPSCSKCCKHCCKPSSKERDIENSDILHDVTTSQPSTQCQYVYAISDRPGEKLYRRAEIRSHGDSGFQNVETNAPRDEPELSLNVNSISQPVSSRNQPSLNPNGSNSNNEPPLYISPAIDRGSLCSRPQIPHRSAPYDGRSRSRHGNGIHGNGSHSYNGNRPHRFIVDNYEYRSRHNGEEDWVVLENVRSFTPSSSDGSRSNTTGRLWNSYVSAYMESLPRSPPPSYSEQLNNYVQQRLYNSPPPSYYSDI